MPLHIPGQVWRNFPSHLHSNSKKKKKDNACQRYKPSKKEADNQRIYLCSKKSRSDRATQAWLESGAGGPGLGRISLRNFRATPFPLLLALGNFHCTCVSESSGLSSVANWWRSNQTAAHLAQIQQEVWVMKCWWGCSKAWVSELYNFSSCWPDVLTLPR